jgi:hypothetical protein
VVSRAAERQVSFADWELMRQGLRLEPLLQAISDFLDDQKDMIEQVRCDLIRGLKNAETGRRGLTRPPFQISFASPLRFALTVCVLAHREMPFRKGPERPDWAEVPRRPLPAG